MVHRDYRWSGATVLGVFILGLLTMPAMAQGQGTVKIDPGDVFEGDVDRLVVYAHFNDTSDTLDMEVAPNDILDGADDRRKSFPLPADREFILYARAFAGTNYRISLFAQNLGPALTLNNGQAVLALFQPVEPVFLPPQFIIDPLDSVLLRLVFRFGDGELIDVDRSLFYVVFALPPEAGEIVAAGTGYVFTAGPTPGTYDITATIKVGDHPLHSYLEPFARATAAIVSVVVKSPGGMAIAKDGTLYISDTEGGFVAMIPPGKKGFALVRGLDRPGDVELGPGERTLIIADKDGKVVIWPLGLTGQLRDLDGNLIVGASVILESPSGGTPGSGSTIDVRKTDKEGLFHVFGLLKPTTLRHIPIFITIEYSGKTYSMELPIAPEGHAFQELSLDTVKLTMSREGQGTLAPTAGAHTYSVNLDLPFEATPNTGWRFDHWEGALTGTDNPTQLKMDEDKVVKAVFVPI
jgi:Divergent InlB B-repeat domain